MKYCIQLIITALMIFSGSVTTAADKKDILKQRQDLEHVQKEVEESRKKLEALKVQESTVQKKVTEYDQRIESNKKVVSRLSSELKALQSNIKQTEAELDKTQEQYDLSIKRYLGNIRQFYISTQPESNVLSFDPNVEVSLERRITFLTALAGYESKSIGRSSDYLSQTIDAREKLLGEKKKVSKLKQTKETSTSLEKSKKEKDEKELEKLRRKKTQEADRLITLEQAAREMEMILVRLEQERRDQPGRRHSEGTSFFVNMKGQLRAPYQGSIVASYGTLVDKVTKLKSFSPGISIKGLAAGPVYAVAAGSVAYVGDLRGYGKFVIIDHDGQYFTTYAGLEQPLVIVSELVATGMKIGLATTDGLVKFELRKGREPLDPVPWITLDAF
ncbi:MAG: murein hydrolase activator EnvC family protein [Candidatus Zixiibacteriota bacterium]